MRSDGRNGASPSPARRSSERGNRLSERMFSAGCSLVEVLSVAMQAVAWSFLFSAPGGQKPTFTPALRLTVK